MMNWLRSLKSHTLWVFALGIAWSIAAAAPIVVDPAWFRPEVKSADLKQALGDNVSGRWIYHDLDAARAAAKTSGKPILAMFRCVPCGSAQKLDEEISGENSPFADLLDQCVCVRVVKMNGVNRHVFEFDRDVQYVAMLMNSDGTVYGRWGTRASSSRKDLPRHTPESFRVALERGLQLHAGYPANRATLAGKQSGHSQSPAMADDLPTLNLFPYNPPEVKNCIHCHTEGEANLTHELMSRKAVLSDVWPYPLADNVGIRLEIKAGLTVKSVTPGSPAERAGVQVGDDLVRLEGQPLISEADVQWVLHHLKDEAQPQLSLLRAGKPLDVTLSLSGAWRRGQTEWRESLTPARPNIHLSAQPGKEKHGIAPGDMALSVSYPRGPAAKAGLKHGDLLISVDGRKDLLTEADFLKYIHIDRPEAGSAAIVVLRQGASLTLTLPLR